MSPSFDRISRNRTLGAIERAFRTIERTSLSDDQAGPLRSSARAARRPIPSPLARVNRCGDATSPPASPHRQTWFNAAAEPRRERTARGDLQPT
jgi:hypothetical protein